MSFGTLRVMRTLRHLALGFAALAFAGAARAADVTYPQLNTLTTVQDTDLIATWRAAGPLSKVQASVLNAYIQGKLNPVYLQIGNSLSELSSTAATARTNLGLGSAATQNTGTSGVALCLMNANCTWSGTETFNAAVTMNGGLTVNGNEGVTGTATVGTLSVTGNSSVTGTETAGSLTVTTSAALPASATVGGKPPLTDFQGWQAYTPAIAPTPQSGSFVSVSYTSPQYMRINKTIFFQASINVASIGTAGGCLTVGLPFVSSGNNITAVSAFNIISGVSGNGFVGSGSSTAEVCSSTGGAPYSNAAGLVISGFYQAAS